MVSPGEWNDQDCSLVAKFICEKSNKVSTEGKFLAI